MPTEPSNQPPRAFEDFVDRHAHELWQITNELTGNPTLAERLRIELLSRVAGRWPSFTRRAEADEDLRVASDIYLATQITKEESNLTDAPPEYRQPANREAGYSFGAATGRKATSHTELAAKAWLRARHSRRNRWWAVAAAVAALGLIAWLVQPATKPTDKTAVIPVPADVTVLPSGDALLALPTAPSFLPSFVNMDPQEVIFDLSTHPVDRAIAMFQLPTDDVLILGADGDLRRWNVGGTEPVEGQAGGVVPAMASTSLSPDGHRAVLRGEGQVVVADLTTGQAMTVPAYAHTTGIAWHDDLHVWLSDGTDTGELDVATFTLTPSSVDAQTVGIDLQSEQHADRYLLNSADALTIVSVDGTSAAPGTAAIGAPNWLGAWIGAGYRRGSTVVGTADATGLTLPDSVGAATRAAVVVRDGRYAAALVATDASGSSESSLTVLGWLDDTHILVATQTGSSPVLVQWDVQSHDLTVLSRLTAAASISLATGFLAA